MTKIYATKPNTSIAPQPRSFRRFVKRVFGSFLKRQTDGNENGFQKEVLKRLKDIEDMIARKTAGKAKRSK
jgi:hypothetical protein